MCLQSKTSDTYSVLDVYQISWELFEFGEYFMSYVPKQICRYLSLKIRVISISRWLDLISFVVFLSGIRLQTRKFSETEMLLISLGNVTYSPKPPPPPLPFFACTSSVPILRKITRVKGLINKVSHNDTAEMLRLCTII